jgi:hypothetical protein
MSYGTAALAAGVEQSVLLTRAAWRDLELAAGGFFLVDAEFDACDESASLQRSPRIAGLTVHVRARTGRTSLSVRAAA